MEYGGVKAEVTVEKITVYVSKGSKLGQKLSSIGCRYYSERKCYVVGMTYEDRYKNTLLALQEHKKIVQSIKDKKKVEEKKFFESAKDLKSGRYGNIYMFRASFYSGYVLTMTKYDKAISEKIRELGGQYIASTSTYHFGIEDEKKVRCLLGI